MTNYEMVREFQEAMGLDLDLDLGNPKAPNFPDVLGLRCELINEEVDELAKGWVSGDLENILKEMVDVVYVIQGFCATFGWDFDEAFRRVHRSNMSKLGDDGKPVYRKDGKVMKSDNYVPCDLGDLI